MKSFSLHAFSTPGISLPFKIEGTIAREAQVLRIHYSLIGPLTELEIEAPGIVQERQDKLWEKTCFEFFLGPRGSAQYWEFNLSPNGNWNAYHFQEYRKGMQQEPAFSSLPFQFRRESSEVQLELKVDLNFIIPPEQALEVGISAILKFAKKSAFSSPSNKSGETFWALVHPGKEPDFHRRDSYVVEL
ncbi:MAG: DOMON-like domain-containing protein [Candidatus Ozemobacteraceae bacterium]